MVRDRETLTPRQKTLTGSQWMKSAEKAEVRHFQIRQIEPAVDVDSVSITQGAVIYTSPREMLHLLQISTGILPDPRRSSLHWVSSTLFKQLSTPCSV